MWPGEGCEQVWRILGVPDLAACRVEDTCPDGWTWICIGTHCVRLLFKESMALHRNRKGSSNMFSGSGSQRMPRREPGQTCR